MFRSWEELIKQVNNLETCKPTAHKRNRSCSFISERDIKGYNLVVLCNVTYHYTVSVGRLDLSH